MTMPNPDQTEGIWIGRTEGQGYHCVQDVFPGNSPREAWHRANCRILIARGHLQAEHENNHISFEGALAQRLRYIRVHV